MTKEQEQFMIKNQKIDEICKETQDYGRMQFVDRIADLEIDKDNLIKYLEDKIKEHQYSMNNVRRGFYNYVIARTKRNTYQDILERVKSGKYE